MAEDLFEALRRFHREVVVPDLDSRIGPVRHDLAHAIGAVRDELGQQIGALDQTIESFRNEMLSHFDAVYKRFDRLESEYQALAAAVARLEARSVTRAEFQSEIDDLKTRVKELERRIEELEAEL